MRTTHWRTGWIAPALALALGLATGHARAQALIRDIATDANDPDNLEDSEPSIAVNPTNPLDIAIVAFSELWSPTRGAPVWKSRDGGLTWSKVWQITQPGSDWGPGDQKIAFDSQGRLFIAELDLAVSNYVMRQAGAADAALTAGAGYGNDQPQLEVDRSSTACANAVYSPWLDYGAGQRSMVERSTDLGATVTAVGAGDNSSFPNRTTRSALGNDGRAYIIYKTRHGTVDSTFENARFHVNRSDDCGVTWNAVGTGGTFPSGASTVQTFFTSSWGNSAKGKVGRARSSDAWIATDPVTGDVYAAFVQKDSSGFGQIYVARSTTQASSWSAPVRVTDGTHHSAYPEIAVASNGAVGVLYIDYDDSGAATLFRHHFSRSFDHGANWSNEVLDSMNPTPLTNAADGFLWGDYEGLTALGNTFYGVFTAQGTGRTTAQLDPIFFREGAVATGSDFYVRDWTDSMVSGDDGIAPSTHQVFYATSDVWNQRTPSVAAQFNANNQPNHETPVAGAGDTGTNFAFARIFRNAPGPAVTVTAHFMVSEFGTGSSYVDIGSESIPFAAAQTMQVTPAHPWHLDPTASTHLCLAVELSESADPFVPPSLIGRTPGWPATDLMVIGDNNKAQRNTGVFPLTEGHPVTEYAVIHNGATFTRTMAIGYSVDPGALRRLTNATIGVVDGGAPQPLRSRGTLSLANMRPGENRWLALSYALAPGAGSNPVAFNFAEVRDGVPVNGFAIIARPVSPAELMRDNLRFHQRVTQRLAALHNVEVVKDEPAEVARALKRPAPAADEYQVIARTHAAPASVAWSKLLATQRVKDSLGVQAELRRFTSVSGGRDAGRTAMAHTALLHKQDAMLTMLHKSAGDPADVLQNVLWQNELFTRAPALKQFADPVVAPSAKFVQGYQARKLRAGDYPPLIKELLATFRKVQAAQPALQLGHEVDAMEKSLGSPAHLQKAHREFLLKLEHLAPR